MDPPLRLILENPRCLLAVKKDRGLPGDISRKWQYVFQK